MHALEGNYVRVFQAFWRIRVIDADTIERDGTCYRLMGFDAPETRRAQSDHEADLGYYAADRLRELLAPPNKVKLKPAGKVDRNGRTLARLYINGIDVAAIAIKEGWGIAYHGEKRRSRPDSDSRDIVEQ